MRNLAQFSGSYKPRSVQANQDIGAKRPWMRRFASFAEMDVSYEEADRLLLQRLNPVRPSITPGLLNELVDTLSITRQGYADDVAAGRETVRYMVLISQLRGMFLLGGDLPSFVDWITKRDEASLRRYAHRCIDIVYGYATSLSLPIHTIALVQGDALGGGFEGVLAQDTIIAEKSAKFGLPEVLFNLFPGMGAYTLLSRRMDPIRAEQMILSGKIYTAQEVYDMGLVDILVEDGQGEAALYDYIERHERNYTSRQSIMKARKIARPVSYEELLSIVEVWVEAAMSLGASDLRKMQRLAMAQDRRHSTTAVGSAADMLAEVG